MLHKLRLYACGDHVNKKGQEGTVYGGLHGNLSIELWFERGTKMHSRRLKVPSVYAKAEQACLTIVRNISVEYILFCLFACADGTTKE